MDPLEKRIKELHDELQQVEQPDRLAIWNGIVRTPPVEKRPEYRSPWRWAAAAAVLLLIGAGFGYWWSETRHRNTETAGLAYLPPEWQVKVREYQTLVGLREKALQLNRPDAFVASDEFRELQVLDSLQQTFLADFAAMPKDQRSAARYLHYYEQKMRIIELIIKEIEIHKHEEEKRVQQQI